jgi:hypothetical protein
VGSADVQRRFVEEVQNQGRLETIDELVADDFVDVAGLQAQLS